MGRSCTGTAWSREDLTVSIDDALVGDVGKYKDQDKAEATAAVGRGYVKIFVLRDSRSQALFGRVVPVKGMDDRHFAVDLLVEGVKWLGYSRATLKSDNEPAIVELFSEFWLMLMLERLEQVLDEKPP